MAPESPTKPKAEPARLRLKDALARLPRFDGARFMQLFEHGTLSVEIYAPRGRDDQTPHNRDEAYVVTRGSGTFWNGKERHPFEAGDFLFVPAGTPHRFEAFTEDLSVWVLFFGPEGGEPGKSHALA